MEGSGNDSHGERRRPRNSVKQPPDISSCHIASKLCEKIVLEQFRSHRISKNLLSPHQSGNKKHHSTETLNIFGTDTMLEAMGKKELVLLYISKAVDSINHHRLLHNLVNVGASPATVQWFKNYLSDRFLSTESTPPYLIDYQLFTEYPK
ncbi:Hypothetical predicted protein, partial [Paramuricea clavata]